MQVKHYRCHASPADGQDGKSQVSLGCVKKSETPWQQAKQDPIRQISDKQFDIPSSRVLGDETNLRLSSVPCQRNLVPGHSLRCHILCQVCVGFFGQWCGFTYVIFV